MPGTPGQQQQDPSPQQQQQDPPPPPPQSQPVNLTQEDINRIAAREKDEGRKSGQRAVLQELGFESMEQAQEFRRQLLEAEQAQLSEIEREKRAAQAAREEAERIRRLANEERHNLAVERILLGKDFGVDPSIVEDVRKLVGVEVGSSPEEIITAVAELKQRLPQLFTPGQPGTPPPPGGDPGRKHGTTPPSDPSQRARDRLQSRHGARLKKQS